jgi:two-component system chemotaxis sensor kinase CheA
MVSRLEQVPRSRIERIAGAEVIQYRDSIMPIVRPEEIVALGEAPATTDDQTLIVFDFGRVVAMAVRSILDVVESDIDTDMLDDASDHTLGRAVIQGRTTLLLDVYSIVRKLAPQFVQERRRPRYRPKVLLVDDSSAMLAALAGFLRTAGMDVTTASNGDNALRKLRAQQRPPFDALITDVEMDDMDGITLVEQILAEQPTLPAFVWTYRDEPELVERARAAGARACINKMHRESLVQAMEAEGVMRTGAQSTRKVS